MVSFQCFRNGKCEWKKGLQDFAIQFNEAFGKDYNLSQCLDISKRESKQPEVLLEASGDKPMVIECKKIVYPRDYYQKHQHFHDFFDCIYYEYKNRLRSILTEDIYEIGINQNDLYEQKAKKLPSISNQIVSYILQNIEEFYVSNYITSKEPIPWYFRQFPEIERDDESYTSGLRLYSSVESGLYRSKVLVEAEKEIANQLAQHLTKTDMKFKEYADCLKVLVIEICGDILSIPAPKVIVEIIKNANIPPSVDQIWLADPEDEAESIITYHQIV